MARSIQIFFQKIIENEAVFMSMIKQFIKDFIKHFGFGLVDTILSLRMGTTSLTSD